MEAPKAIFYIHLQNSVVRISPYSLCAECCQLVKHFIICVIRTLHLNYSQENEHSLEDLFHVSFVNRLQLKGGVGFVLFNDTWSQ